MESGRFLVHKIYLNIIFKATEHGLTLLFNNSIWNRIFNCTCYMKFCHRRKLDLNINPCTWECVGVCQMPRVYHRTAVPEVHPQMEKWAGARAVSLRWASPPVMLMVSVLAPASCVHVFASWLLAFYRVSAEVTVDFVTKFRSTHVKPRLCVSLLVRLFW